MEWQYSRSQSRHWAYDPDVDWQWEIIAYRPSGPNATHIPKRDGYNLYSVKEIWNEKDPMILEKTVTKKLAHGKSVKELKQKIENIKNPSH